MLAALLATASLAAPMPRYIAFDRTDPIVTCGTMHMKLCLLETVPFDQRDPLNRAFYDNAQKYRFDDGYEWTQSLILQTRADGPLTDWIKSCRAKLKCRPDSRAHVTDPNGGYYEKKHLKECLTNQMISLDEETKQDLAATVEANTYPGTGWNLVEHILQTCQKDKTRKVALTCHKHLMKKHSKQ